MHCCRTAPIKPVSVLSVRHLQSIHGTPLLILFQHCVRTRCEHENVVKIDQLIGGTIHTRQISKYGAVRTTPAGTPRRRSRRSPRRTAHLGTMHRRSFGAARRSTVACPQPSTPLPPATPPNASNGNVCQDHKSRTASGWPVTAVEEPEVARRSAVTMTPAGARAKERVMSWRSRVSLRHVRFGREKIGGGGGDTPGTP